MGRLAAVDVGSNTVHALVADLSGDGGAASLREVAHYVEMPELGAEVMRTGRIGEAAGRAAIGALKSVLARAAEHGFEHLVAGATAAVRRAADRDQFLAAASAAIGVPVHLIGEAEEARLSFLGVASHHAGRRAWLMVDLGGGSTELVSGLGRQLLTWASLPIGSGVLAATHLSDPPAAGERESLRQALLPHLGGAPESEPEKMVVTGGTASNLPFVISPNDPPDVLTVRDLLEAEWRLDGRPAAALAAETGLEDKRIRAMRAGVEEALLLLLDWAGLDRLHISHQGIRHGMLLRYGQVGDRWWQPESGEYLADGA